jgi:hypothetical protein
MIWRFSFPPRHVCLSGGSLVEPEKWALTWHPSTALCHRDRNKTRQEFPPGLRINKESRDECIRYYHFVFPKIDARYPKRPVMWYCECSLPCPSLPLWINTEVDTVFIDFLDLKWRDENPEDYEERKFLHIAEQAPQIFEAIRVLEIRNIPVIADPGIWFTITIPGGVLRQDPHEHQFLTQDVDRIMPSLVRFPFLEVLCLTVQHEAHLRLT